MRRHLSSAAAVLAAALALAAVVTLTACSVAPGPSGVVSSDPLPPVEWAIAIHGGAGTIPRDIEPQRRAAYAAALRAALHLGADSLAAGEPALDVVEKVVRSLEDDPLFNAGRGAVYTHEGHHELDAALMDGRDLSAGAVASVTNVKNPISLARLVMERTPHVLLVGPGAEAFAAEMGVVRVPQEYFDTEYRYRAWQRVLEEAKKQDDKDTVGCVVRDVHGDLAAATSTGGLTDKRFGRVGDVPIVGAGTYADNRTCAVSATGQGEEFIRHAVAHTISSRMAYLGESVGDAARAVIHGILKPGDGGVISVDAAGRIALVFSSQGMYRGAADSTGRFEIGIWEEMER